MKMSKEEILENIIYLINLLNSNDSSYNFRLTRGMCVEKYGHSVYTYLDNLLLDINSYQYDYIRLREIELLIDEIKAKKIEGAMAEVGVYKGDISAFLNKLLPEKKLYLFDTFTGFTEELLSENSAQDYSCNTFFEYVNNSNFPHQKCA